MSNAVSRLLVVLLVAANVVLIDFAVTHHAKTLEQTHLTVPPPTIASTPTAAPLPEIRAARVRPATASAQTLFSVASAAEAWRATGGCIVPANLTGTDDGGGTWIPLAQPAPHLLAIQITGSSTGWVVGADETCQPAYYATSDGGATWTAGDAAKLDQTWFITTKGIHAPGDTTVTPCGKKTTLALTAAGTEAIATCPRGLFRTSDGGATWTPTGRVPRGQVAAVALGPDGQGVLLMSSSPRCRGLRAASTTDNGASWTARDCLIVAQPPAVVSLAANGEGLLASLRGTYRTTDFGVHWE